MPVNVSEIGILKLAEKGRQTDTEMLRQTVEDTYWQTEEERHKGNVQQ